MSIYIQEPRQSAKACVIFLHGLGAGASDMQGLVQQFPATTIPCKYIFLDAPLRPVTINNGMTMRAWYDITGFTASAREDLQGIQSSEKIIRDVIEQQVAEGFDYSQIVLAGFSQGGAIALYTALHTKAQLGGVIALSSYLPVHQHCQPTLYKNTPFFIAGGTMDPVVLPAWTNTSRDWLLQAGYNRVDFHQYPMEHSICYQEIQDMCLWLTNEIQGAIS